MNGTILPTVLIKITGCPGNVCIPLKRVDFIKGILDFHQASSLYLILTLLLNSFIDL